MRAETALIGSKMNNRMIGTAEVADLLASEERNILILTHTHPDADTLGSAAALALALRSLGKKAEVLVRNIPDRYSFLEELDVFLCEDKGALQSKVIGRLVVSVDIASLTLLGDYEDLFTGKIDIAIDHHLGNSIEADLKVIDHKKAACGELIYEIIKSLNVEITPDIATALYAAISSDTGGFKFSSVSPKTHLIAAELIETGIDFAEINRLLFETKTKEQFILEKLAYTATELCFDDKIAIIAFTNEMLTDIGINVENMEFGAISQLPRQLEGVEVGVVIRPSGKPEDQKFKVSMRSNRFVNVSEICAAFGGGGHYHAAGCTLSGDIEAVKTEIVREVEKGFEKTRITNN